MQEKLLKKLFEFASIAPMDALRIIFMVLAVMPTVVFAGTSGPTPIPPPPAFQISTSVLTLCRGVENNIPILVTNPGAWPMTSLQLGILSSRNIYVIGNGTVNQATIPANGSTTVSLPLFVSLNTSNLVSVGISVNYNYYTLYSDSEVRNASFGVETCPSPLSVQTSPVVTSGRIDNLTLNITNTGNRTLNSVSLSISIPPQDAATLTHQPIQIGTMLPGATTQVIERAFVFRNASQSFPLNVSIQLYNGTSPVQILDTFPLLSAGTINMSASSVTLSPTTPTAGSIFSVSLILTDIGTTGASAVTVTPLSPAGIASYGSNSVFVGDMSVDTQVPVTMTFSSSTSLKSGVYTIPVRISYLNNLRNNVSSNVSVLVTLGSGSLSNFTRNGTAVRFTRSGGSNPLVSVFAVLVVAIVLVIAYIKRKGIRKWIAQHRAHAGK